MTQRERSGKARQRWQGLLAEQGRSGERVAAFCRERQLCASHFYWWKKRLGASGGGEFVEGKVAAAGSTLGGGGERLGASGGEKFVEVKLAAAASTLGAGEDRRVEVVLRNGRSLRVGPGFDPELVRALAAVLE